MRGQRGSRKKLEELRLYLEIKEARRQKIQEAQQKRNRARKKFIIAALATLAASAVGYLFF